MPPFECFNNAASYYGTLAHEVTHWTKHTSRLNRDFNRKKWGDEGYAMEELVAELGPVNLLVALIVAPQGSQHRRPGSRNGEESAAARQRLTPLVHDLGLDAGERLRR